MKIILPACDHDYSDGVRSGTINGGTVWLHNIASALRSLGEDAEVVPLSFGERPDADVIIMQSEWTGMPEYRSFKGKKVILLGHFIKHVYPDPHTMGQDLLVSMWEGELLNGFGDVKFMPHAYADTLEEPSEPVNHKGDVVWVGNPYQLRDEGYFAGIEGITPVRGTYPKDLFPIYRGANVCPNIHGDFQKNIVSNQPSKIADRPGMMVNERFWNVLGCGGVLVTDFVPQMLKWFDEDELIIGKTKEEFQKLVEYYRHNPGEGRSKLERAKKKVREQHTYRNRAKDLLGWINNL